MSLRHAGRWKSECEAHEIPQTKLPRTRQARHRNRQSDDTWCLIAQYIPLPSGRDLKHLQPALGYKETPCQVLAGTFSQSVVLSNGQDTGVDLGQLIGSMYGSIDAVALLSRPCDTEK